MWLALSVMLSIGSERAKNRRRSFSVRGHRSKIMHGVLVVILRPDYIAALLAMPSVCIAQNQCGGQSLTDDYFVDANKYDASKL